MEIKKKSRLSNQRFQVGVGAALLLIVASLLGAGAYFVGKDSGEDLAQARALGQRTGEAAGRKQGKRGFAVGFSKGRSAGFKRTYGTAYREAYRQQFDEAGLEPPAAKEVKVER